MADTFVIDNSVVMSWCFYDEADEYSDFVLDKLIEKEAIVPYIWPFEVANVLLVAERRDRIQFGESLEFLEYILQLPIFMEQKEKKELIKGIYLIGREYKLSSYDASYLELAWRRKCPLASFDKNLIAAAKKMKVPILESSC